MGWMDELKTTAGLRAALALHGPRLVAGLMVAVIAVQAGFLVTSQNRGVTGATPAHGPVSGPVGGARPEDSALSALRVSEITSAHLFGETHSTVNDANAPQTSAQLVLAGVLAVPDPKRGLAIIGPNAGSAKLYTVGSAVPGGVSLYSVYPDRVLLDRGGVIESLLLPRKGPLAGMPAATSDAGLNGGQRLASFAQGNGALLGGLVRAQPVFVGSKLSGYRIYPGGRTSIGAFTHLGLRPGDLITGVNGTPLDDPNRASEILQTLSSSANANVTVLRNGQSQEITLNLETVANDAENAAAAARRGSAVNSPGGAPNRFPGLINAQSPGMASSDDAEPPPVEDPPDNAPNEQQ
jgi:general secretion pathway protein C